jgi:hypothetical protein
MTLFYFTVVLPFGIVHTFFSDPLKIKRPSFEIPRRERHPVGETLEAAQRQF